MIPEDIKQKILQSPKLDREKIKKVLEERLVKNSVFMVAKTNSLLRKLFSHNYNMDPTPDESEVMIFSIMHDDQINICAIGKKNKSLQESLCYKSIEDTIEPISDNNYENLALIIVEETISRPNQQDVFLARPIVITNDEGKRIIIDKILDIIFADLGDKNE